MPRHYAKKKTTKRTQKKKATYRKKRYAKKSKLNNQVFPLELHKTFHASLSDVALATAAGEMKYIQINANNLVNPFDNYTTNKPRYLDTYLGANDTHAPYARYLVHACKVVCTFYPIGIATSAADGYWRVGIVPRIANASRTTDMDEARLRIGAVTKGMVTGMGQKPVTLSKYVEIRKWWARSNLRDSADIFGGDSSGVDPINMVFMDICGQPITKAGAYGCYIDVKVELYTSLYSLNDVEKS